MNNSLPTAVFLFIASIGALLTYWALTLHDFTASAWIMLAALLLAIFISTAIKISDQWNRAVVLRLGRFQALKGPGLFLIIPIIETIPYWIDTRVITTAFKAEKTLTKDTVPVDVDAVLFWKVVDPAKAALDVADYQSAVGWASQTALRDAIGKTMLADMLKGRQSGDDLRQGPHSLSSKGDEYALRGAQAERHHRHRAQYGS